MEIKTFRLTGADQQMNINASYYCGFAVRETSGAAVAKINIYSGADATGELVDVINLLANESSRELYPDGIGVDDLFIDVVSGAVEGTIRFGRP